MITRLINLVVLNVKCDYDVQQRINKIKNNLFTSKTLKLAQSGKVKLSKVVKIHTCHEPFESRSIEGAVKFSMLLLSADCIGIKTNIFFEI